MYFRVRQPQGKMPEWSNGPHSKCGERVTVPWVRIPVFPPFSRFVWAMGKKDGAASHVVRGPVF